MTLPPKQHSFFPVAGPLLLLLGLMYPVNSFFFLSTTSRSITILRNIHCHTKNQRHRHHHRRRLVSPHLAMSAAAATTTSATTLPSWTDLTQQIATTPVGQALNAEVELRRTGQGSAHVHNTLRTFDDSSTHKEPSITLFRDYAGWCPYWYVSVFFFKVFHHASME